MERTENGPILHLTSGWRAAPDFGDEGKSEKWYLKGIPKKGSAAAAVPGFVHQFLPDCRGIAWYENRFCPDLAVEGDHELELRFGMADFLCQVWLNGQPVGSHRGTEDPFAFSVSALVLPGEENVLIVRVSKPYTKDVDGYRFGEIPHRNQVPEGLLPGCCYNEFGLSGPVELARVPKTRLSDIFLNGNGKTGCAELRCMVKCGCGEETAAVLRTVLVNKRTGETEAEDVCAFAAKPGEMELFRSIPVKNPLLWDVDDPNLYLAELSLETERTVYRKSRSFGFRTFEVGEDGYFRLNGRRIFLRCSHTGNCMPESTHHYARDKSLLRKDLYLAKAMGLNMVRFIAGAALPEQLDYCDELGLMVWEEPVSAWMMESGPRTEELYLGDLLPMIVRDRSHPSVVIWGLLNETFDDEPRRAACLIAREALGRVRELDGTRLVLYSSGRWDGDARVGSVANPGSRVWQCLWNAEGQDLRAKVDLSDGFTEHVGDFHDYPKVPLNAEAAVRLRTMGSRARRPVFCSEAGIGSMFDVLWLARKFEETGADPNAPDVRMVNAMAEQLLKDLKRFGMEEEFAFPGDLLRESQREHCRHRALLFDLLRSNPYCCGYSITGLLDHSICGEGLLTLMREWKPGIADTMQAGLAPLKWCLFLSSTHVYRSRKFTVEGVLANEDVLKTREYAAEVKITGPAGTVWSRTFRFSVTEENTKGLSIPVFRETVSLNVPSGTYHLRAELISGAAAWDGDREFTVTDPEKFRPKLREIAVCGALGRAAEELLAGKGIKIIPLASCREGERHAILVGDLTEEEKGPAWEKLRRMMENGSRVFAASRYAFRRGDDWEYYLPLAQKPENLGHGEMGCDSLYHKEYVAKRGSPYFAGLPTGLMSWYFYGDIINGHRFACRDGEEPEEVHAACFATGMINSTGCEDGVALATWRVGVGALTISAFHLLGNIGKTPAADKLLLNAAETEDIFIQ